MNTEKFEVSQIQLFPQSDFSGGRTSVFSANIAINGEFMIQLGTDGEFSIPFAREAAWGDDAAQDWAQENLDADELAEQLKIPTDYSALLEMGGEEF